MIILDAHVAWLGRHIKTRDTVATNSLVHLVFRILCISSVGERDKTKSAALQRLLFARHEDVHDIAKAAKALAQVPLFGLYGTAPSSAKAW